MSQFAGKTAVITGAASGLGRAIASRCVEEGMNVVLAGINANTLAEAECALRERGGTVLSVPTDVSRWQDVEHLAAKTQEIFGKVHLLVNNAGVGAGTTIWESTLHDWEWVLNVNLWGTIHCLRAFVPIMLQQEEESQIVNISSIAALMTIPKWGVYRVSKESQIAIAETLQAELQERGANIRVSVACPAFVQSNIANSKRNRPPELFEAAQDEALEKAIKDGVEGGISAEAFADRLFEGIHKKQMYIFTHPNSGDALRERFASILEAADGVPVNT